MASSMPLTRRSTLHPSNVAATCSKCHQSIEGRLETSVHRRGDVSAAAKEKPPAGAKSSASPFAPTVTRGIRCCRRTVAEFRPPIDDSCGNCHAELYSRYSLTMHATLTDRGYTAAAKCSNCHGSHDIVPVNDPNSRVFVGENRLRTCQQCHAHAVSNFAQFDPHANFKNAARYPTFPPSTTGSGLSSTFYLSAISFMLFSGLFGHFSIDSSMAATQRLRRKICFAAV